MVKIALRRPDNIAYIIDEMDRHYICVGFSGDELEYSCRHKFPLDRQEREALGSLGRLGKLAEDRAEMFRQQEEVLAIANCKSTAARLHGERDAAAIDIPGLAGRIFAVVKDDPKWKKGSLERPWYMVNIAHPVAGKLLDRYCMKNGINRHFPLSDQERIAFELQLLRPGVLREVEAAVAMAEEDNRHGREAGQKERG